MTRERIFGKDAAFLAVLLLMGLILRLDFLIPSNFIIDADEAIVGLMAKHVSEGADVPVFYYGQHYMGSFEPFLVSLLFRVFGVSAVALKAVPLVFSLLLILVIYRLGCQTGGRGVGLTAAIFCAIPPSTLVVWSAKARGGFIELVFIGTYALLQTCYWMQAEKPSLKRAAYIAFLLGFGWWVNNQIIFFMLPIGFCMLGRLLYDQPGSPGQRVRAVFAHLLTGTAAFLAGGFPFWLHNFYHNFASFKMFTGSGAKQAMAHVSGLFTSSIPMILGAKQFWERRDLFPYSTLIYCGLYFALFAAFLWIRRYRVLNLLRLKIGRDSAPELILLFVFATFSVFALSSFGYLVQAPRYLLPVYAGIFILSAWVIERLRRVSSVLANVMIVAVCTLSLLSSYVRGRAVPGEPFVYENERVSKDHTELINWLYDNNYQFIRTNYWIGYRIAFETEERVRFSLFQKPAEARIKKYQKEACRLGEQFMPLVLVPSQARMVERAMKSLGYSYEFRNLSGYRVLYNIQPRYGDLQEITPDQFVLESSLMPEELLYAVDNDLETRWRSARPQDPDMRLTVNFTEPRRIAAIQYDLGIWPQDYPRALQIEAELENGEKRIIFDDDNYGALRYFIDSNPEFSVYFEPVKVRKVVFHQTGKDPVFDWSVAEIKFFDIPGSAR